MNNAVFKLLLFEREMCRPAPWKKRELNTFPLEEVQADKTFANEINISISLHACLLKSESDNKNKCHTNTENIGT